MGQGGRVCLCLGQWSYTFHAFTRTWTPSINAQCWSKMHLLIETLINDDWCWSMPINSFQHFSKYTNANHCRLIGIKKYWGELISDDWHWEAFVIQCLEFDWYWSALPIDLGSPVYNIHGPLLTKLSKFLFKISLKNFLFCYLKKKFESILWITPPWQWNTPQSASHIWKKLNYSENRGTKAGPTKTDPITPEIWMRWGSLIAHTPTPTFTRGLDTDWAE